MDKLDIWRGAGGRALILLTAAAALATALFWTSDLNGWSGGGDIAGAQTANANLLSPSFSTLTLDEGEAATVTVTRATAGAEAVSVSAELSGGDIAGAQLSDATLTIPANQKSGAITITALGDHETGVASTVNLRLRATTAGYGFGATAAETGATLTLLDDDVRLAAFFDPPAIDEGETATLTVRRDSGAVQRTLGEAVTVRVTLAGDVAGLSAPAQEQIDITIPGGELAASAEFAATNDRLTGDATRVNAVLSEGHDGFALTASSATLNLALDLTDDDVLLRARIESNSIAEGEATALVVERWDGPISSSFGEAVTLEVDLSLAGGIELAESSAKRVLTLTIEPHKRTARQTLTAVDNSASGDDTTATLTITSLTDGFAFEAGALTDTRELTLRDNDNVILTAELSPTSVDEGETAWLTISRPTARATEAIVNLQGAHNLRGGFVLPSALVIPANERSFSIPIVAPNDNAVGDGAFLNLNLTAATDGYAFSASSRETAATLTITDDDVSVTAFFDPDEIHEGESTYLFVRRDTGAVMRTLNETITLTIKIEGDADGLTAPTATDFEIIVPAGWESAAFEFAAGDDRAAGEASHVDVNLGLNQDGFTLFGSLNNEIELELILEDGDVELEAHLERGSIAEGETTELAVERVITEGGGHGHGHGHGHRRQPDRAAPPVFIPHTHSPDEEEHDPLHETVVIQVDVRFVSGGVRLAEAPTDRVLTLIIPSEQVEGHLDLTALENSAAGDDATVELRLRTLTDEFAFADGSLTDVLILTLRDNDAVVRTTPPPPRARLVAPTPPPANPPEPPPDAILGAPVGTPAEGGQFEGPSNSEVVVPPGAAEVYFGVSVTELADMPDAELPPSLGEFVPGALALDVTFRNQRGVEITRLDNAATVCLPVDAAIMSAVDGDARRLRIVRYHAGVWTALVSEYDAFEERICARSQLFSAFALTATPPAQAALPGAAELVGFELTGALPQTGGVGTPLWLTLTLAWAGAALLCGGALFVRRAARR